MNNSKSKSTIYSLVAVGLMAALVFVGNYLQIKIPNGVLITRIHLGNSMCLLAGLLFGGTKGGLSSGIGAGMYDLFDPVYIVSAPYTFFSKFAMGFVAGKLNKRETEGSEVKRTIIAAVAGQITYIFLYLVKSYVSILILGGTHEAALSAVGLNAIASSINGVLAVVIAVPLYFALMKALKATSFNQLITKKETSKGYLNPVTVGLIVFAVIVSSLSAINLSTYNNKKLATDEERAEYQSQIDDLQSQIDSLEEKLDSLVNKED